MAETEPMGPRYLVAGSKPWNRRVFAEKLAHLPGEWFFASGPEELTPERVGELRPRYIFFLHWSWIVPKVLVEQYECVCFHMTDVPYGRGGSPLQNLIVRGHRNTKLTALRMDEGLDTGPVYFKEDLSLEGSAEEIYLRAAYRSAELIERLVRETPTPTAQSGEPVVFRRRKPSDSRIEAPASLVELHDFIRMLDADGYPHAFIEHGGFRLEFRRAALYDGRIEADVIIKPQEESR